MPINPSLAKVPEANIYDEIKAKAEEQAAEEKKKKEKESASPLKMSVFTIRLPEEYMQKLNSVAAKVYRKPSELARIAIMQYLDGVTEE